MYNYSRIKKINSRKFSARLAPAKLATKADIDDSEKKICFDEKLNEIKKKLLQMKQNT